MDVPNSRWQEISVLKMFKVTSNLSHALKQPSAGEKKKKRRKKTYKHWKSMLINWLKSLAGNEHRQDRLTLWREHVRPTTPKCCSFVEDVFPTVMWPGESCPDWRSDGTEENLVWVQNCQDNLEQSLEVSGRKGIESRSPSPLQMPLTL